MISQQNDEYQTEHQSNETDNVTSENEATNEHTPLRFDQQNNDDNAATTQVRRPLEINENCDTYLKMCSLYALSNVAIPGLVYAFTQIAESVNYHKMIEQCKTYNPDSFCDENNTQAIVQDCLQKPYNEVFCTDGHQYHQAAVTAISAFLLFEHTAIFGLSVYKQLFQSNRPSSDTNNTNEGYLNCLGRGLRYFSWANWSNSNNNNDQDTLEPDDSNSPSHNYGA